ncbi:MAG: hypothetical protein LC804_24830 [Acidobacteria bacterium]|nr:hypothetical protein [Acidobacteriota bacterium]
MGGGNGGTLIVALRLLAIAIAIGGVIDPAVSVRRSRPVRLDVRLLDESSSAHAARDQLVSHLKDDVATLNAGAADAIVLVGGRPDVSSLPAKVPVFTISLRPTTANVRIVDAASPAASRPGQDVHAIADIEATGMAGRGSVITLEHQGITLGRLEHRWTLERERFRAMLPFTPPAAGTVALRINVTTADERDGTDNATDFRVLSFSRPLKVLIFEARPSWAIAFIRRALESDPTFQIASYARASRGAEVTAGDPPASLTSGGLDAFDAVIAGAPEELGRVEVDALDRFARIRGGAVIFAPDRRPAGPYTTLIPTGDFEQILLDLPVSIETRGRPLLRASELALPRRLVAGAVAVAALARNSGPHPVVCAWPSGAGRVIYAGALDSWRFRNQDDGGFARFWREAVGEAASAAPAPLEIAVDPGIVKPASRVAVRASIRQTEMTSRSDGVVTIPPVSAQLVASNGTATTIRLWPAAETGVYEGTFEAPAPGRYEVRGSAGKHTADTILLVDPDAIPFTTTSDDALRLIAEATGGAAAHADNIRPVVDRLHGMPRAMELATARPMRSAWIIVPFAGLLTAEWAVRRRHGLR